MAKGPRRTTVYIDGFNLFYGQLKGTAWKWLNPELLFQRLLDPGNQIATIKIFTAKVHATPRNPGTAQRQNTYFRALQYYCPRIELYFGHFVRHKVRMEHADPPPAQVAVWKNEEKGSDVNLALHLLNDAWQDAFDCAVIVSNDSDLTEALRLVKTKHRKLIGLVTPGAPTRKTSRQLQQYADFIKPIRTWMLEASQLPISIPGTVVHKPADWYPPATPVPARQALAHCLQSRPGTLSQPRDPGPRFYPVLRAENLIKGMTTESQIEQDLIARLVELKYVHRPDVRDKAGLEKNFREKFEALNRVRLTDAEFSRLRDEIITSDVFTAAQALREKGKFNREDGTPLEYMLVNLRDWCKNEFEVLSQLRINTDNSFHRYDVILLINGLPLVQIELKSLHISPRRAMEQIVEYKNCLGNGYTNSLLCFMQLFIVSNETDTRYFANNHSQHFNFNAEERFLPIYQHADVNNNKIAHLHDFADDFLEKCHLGQLLSRYMVLVQSEQKILIMRPYQIYAVKALVDCIHQNRGNGYIWHTTGSGKTLTSFKAATLLKDNPDIHKCLFVVDRKDLDRQTRDEFNKFQEGCVEQNTNTEVLVRRMLSEDYADKVIVTTIQKLGLALDENSKRNRAKQQEGKQTYKELLERLRDKRVVFIFDECHRSQFGDNHKAIKEFFPKAQLFGFTGTPIFEDNATYQQIDGNVGSYKTTKDIFEHQLHAYTITHAIDDRNVLSFHVDYFGKEGDRKPKKGQTYPVEAVINAILDKHDSATGQRRFNALLATASINSAIEYYDTFKTLQAQRLAANEDFEPLNIACVFSPPAEGNKDVQQLQEDLEREREDNKKDPEQKKAALKAIIDDYNRQYGSNHSINEFDLYYQDVQQRIKDHKYSNADYPRQNKIDITIVVDMLLTGFDSKYLNTLYVDKNLKHHGLIQAFSRTNRILNDSKPWGNVLDFRYQESDVDDAIKLFSGVAIDRAREIWLVDPAPQVVEKFQKAVDQLQSFMEGKGLPCEPAQVVNLKGDTAKAEFINHFKDVQKLKTQLEQYTDLDQQSKQTLEAKLPTATLRSFKAAYLDTALELKRKQGIGSATDTEVDQLEFDLVLFASSIIDYDYIMKLIARSTQRKGGKQKMTRTQLIELISGNANLLAEREDIIAYINSLTAGEVLNEKEIRSGYQRFKAQKAVAALGSIANKHGLPASALQTFVDTILGRMIFDGEQLTDLLAPLELNWKARREAELALMAELVPYLQKLAGGREISGLKAYE